MRLVSTPGQPLLGSVTLPGDKSLSHRAALLAALAEGESVIANFLVSGVTQAMLAGIAALGASWEMQGATLLVQGRGLANLKQPEGPLDCGNSATTLRLLAGALAAAGIPAVLDGSPGLRRRPMGRIVTPLQMMGVGVQASPQGTAPLIFAERPKGQLLRPIRYALPVASAQVKSCLLLAALAGAGPTTLSEPALSRDHTERMLRALGVQVSSESDGSDQEGRVTLTPPSLLCLPPLSIELPGDFSSAAFLIVAALITPGSAVKLEGVGLNSTRTGLLAALRKMGADINVTHGVDRHGEPVGDIFVRYSSLHGVQVSGPLVVSMIDEFPVFAVAAACAQGKTTVSQAAELRHKESDRIATACQELRKLGVEMVETPDGFTIAGGKQLHGGDVAAHGDHRLAMALVVAGLAAGEPVSVVGAEIIAESFPGFSAALSSLGAGIVSVVD